MGLLIYPAVYGTDSALGCFGVGPRRDAAAGVPGTAGLFQAKPPGFGPSRGPRGGANPTRPRHPPRGGPDRRPAGQTVGGRDGRTEEAAPGPGGGTTSPVKLRRPPAAAGLYKREWPGRRSRSISGRGGVGSAPLSLSPGHLRAPGRLLYRRPWGHRCRQLPPSAAGGSSVPGAWERRARTPGGGCGYGGGGGCFPEPRECFGAGSRSGESDPPEVGGGNRGCGGSGSAAQPGLLRPALAPLAAGDAPRSGGELGGEGERLVPVSGEKGFPFSLRKSVWVLFN